MAAGCSWGTVTVTHWLGTDRPYSVCLWTSSHDVFVELAGKNSLEVVARKFCLGAVNNSDGAFEPGPFEHLLKDLGASSDRAFDSNNYRG
jgi:hypothetical protein